MTDPSSTTDIVVSVAMVTYNHEAFVADAIESVLRQQTTFPVELIIGEDFSTDGTRAIVQAYAARFPEKIRLLLPERNRGMMANYAAVLDTCRGRYVALLDGDDYWTDPGKLQKQVDFLESRPECVICIHSVMVVIEDPTSELSCFWSPKQPETSTLADLLHTNFIPACPCLFRGGLFDRLPDWFYTLPWVDWTLHIINAQFGDIGNIDEVMAVYRVHSSNVSRTQWQFEEMAEARLRMYRHLDAYLAPRYHSLLKHLIAYSYYQMAAIDWRRGAKFGALRNLLISLTTSPTSPPVSYRWLLRKLL